MSKKLLRIFSVIFLLAFLAVGKPVFAWNPEASQRIATADGLFEQENYTEAMGRYTGEFEHGYYNEQMLYRLAFMHEKLGDYPEAIYFLRKAAQEYGPRETEEKVRKILRAKNVVRVFSADGWDNYYAFFRTWGPLIWGLFALGAVLVLLHFFLPPKFDFKIRRAGYITGWVLFALTTVILFRHHFYTPTRAVIIDDTSFYTYPSFAAETSPGAFSPGELVTIESEKDIWVEVNAGGRAWWVPKMVVREL